MFTISKLRGRKGLVAAIGLVPIVLGLGVLIPFKSMIKMPGVSFRGPLPELSDEERLLRDNLESHVTVLASDIGDRSYARPDKLEEARDFIDGKLKEYGYETTLHTFAYRDQQFDNIEVELTGAGLKEEIIVIGAHYDTAHNPGANDNGTGVAALLELARLLKDRALERTVRLVAFPNEEIFTSEAMGSYHYAKRCKDNNEDIVAMVSLETIGYYCDEKGSQKYPPVVGRFYPSEGNFIAFVSNYSNRKLVHRMIEIFRETAEFPSEGLAAPSIVQGVSWSDHSAFWKFEYPALMVTDTAPYRYPYYHTREDTVDKVDFERTARVVNGIKKMVERFADHPS